MSGIMMQILGSGAAAGAGLDVDEVFSTFLWSGNNSTQTITNNIDLSGEGGLVWIKERTGNEGHRLIDTIRGNTKMIRSDATGGNYTIDGGFNDFTSTGFTLEADNGWSINSSSEDYTSWTFRKTPKFFDIVTWSDGDGTTNHSKQISHNLGSTPGMIIVKKVSQNGDRWQVAHRSMSTGDVLYLDDTSAKNGLDANTVRIVNDSYFTIAYNQTNEEGQTYIAYLFAHNNNDGGFGLDGNQDVIKCGSYTGNGSGNGLSINLGFEPQWVMIKRATTDTGDWKIFDAMRGVATGGTTNLLEPNTSDTETANNDIDFDANGFNVINANSRINASNATFIYMAIRRGPLAAPTDATKVFAIDDKGSGGSTTDPAHTSNFVVDMAIRKRTDAVHQWFNSARLISGRFLKTDGNDAESSSSQFIFDYNNGYREASNADTNDISWMWRRAPGYFDVVTYKGNGTAGHTVSHNLGAVPEMMWVKQRPYTSDWRVYHSALGNTKALKLNATAASATLTSAWNSTTPTASVFTLGTSNDTNENNLAHIAYLFATVAGVSKVGSYTGTASSQNIDCGFSSGSRFVLVKRYDGTDSWYIADSVRGISSGQTDKILKLNSTDAQFTESDNSADYIAPHSSGFNLPGDSPFNGSGDDFIFYAIA
jgi:hypothetical protein